jgi:staphylococcal nuclease domain-containing protein 1
MLHLQDSATIAAAMASAPTGDDFNAMSFLNSIGKGKPVAGLVEAVLNGSILRLTLLPDRTPVTVAVAGVQCPSMGKKAPAPAAAESNGTAAAANGEANGEGSAPAGNGAVTAASIAAAGVSSTSAAPGGPEPLAREAKWFTESRCLNR